MSVWQRMCVYVVWQASKTVRACFASLAARLASPSQRLTVAHHPALAAMAALDPGKKTYRHAEACTHARSEREGKARERARRS